MKLDSIAYALGSRSVEPLKLFQDPRLLEKTGIAHVFQEDGSTAGLVIRAAEKVLLEVERQSIDVCLLVTQSPDDLLPANAIPIASALGLRSDVLAFDINQGCSGFVQALCLVDLLLRKYSRVLLLTGDRYRSKLDPADRATNSLFSDAASASVWSAEGPLSLIYDRHLNDGSRRDCLYQPSDAVPGQDYLHMSGSEIWMFTKTRVLPEILKAIRHAQDRGLTVSQLYLHQASKVVVDGLIRGLPENFSPQIPIHYHLYGNTISSTIPILLAENPLQLSVGTAAVFCGFGVGLSCSSVVLTHADA